MSDKLVCSRLPDNIPPHYLEDATISALDADLSAKDLEVAYQRYLNECAIKYSKCGPGETFEVFTSDNKAKTKTDFPFDVEFPQIVVCELFAHKYELLQLYASAGFGASVGVFPGLPAVGSRLASKILNAWLDAANMAMDLGTVTDLDDVAFTRFEFSCKFFNGDHSVTGPVQSHEISDPIAGITDDGLPVLTPSADRTPSTPRRGGSNGNSLTVTLSHSGTLSPFLHHSSASNDRDFPHD